MKKLLLLCALLIFACNNKIDEKPVALEQTNKQSPTQFFSYAREDILTSKSWNCWGPNKLNPHGTMEQRLLEDLNVNGLNPEGYIFYRKQKIYRRDKTVLIKYGPLIISDSIYSNNLESEFRIEANERNKYGNYSLMYLNEADIWSLKGNNDSVINIPLKIKFLPKP